MPVVSMNTVISICDFVDNVPVQEEPRKQWMDKPTDRGGGGGGGGGGGRRGGGGGGGGGGVTNMQEQRSQRYSTDMYRAQSAAKGIRGNPQESSSSLGLSVFGSDGFYPNAGLF